MKKNYQIVKNLAGFEKALDYLAKHDFAAFDIETTGGEEIETQVIGISFACKFDTAFYVVLREWDAAKQVLNSYYDEVTEKIIIEKLTKMLLKKQLIMHNGVYDIVVMNHRYGVDLIPALFCDTILLKHTVDEEHPFGLKDLAKKYAEKLGFSPEEVANQEQLDLKESVLRNGGKWTKKQKDIYKGDVDLIATYGCADADLTLKVFDYLEARLIKEGLEEFFYEQEVMPLYKLATIPMKLGGVYIDVPYFEKLKKEIEDGILKLTDEVFGMIADLIQPKVTEILNSAVQVRKAGKFAIKALEHYGIDPILNKKTGKPTLAKNALKSLKQTYPDHPVIEWLLWEPPTISVVEKITAPTGETLEIIKQIPDPSAEGPCIPQEKLTEIQRELYLEMHPDSPQVFNLNSNKHLAWLLFERCKCKPKDFSRKTGAPKVDKNALHEFDLPFTKTLLKLKQEEKLLGTYVIPILTKQRNGWLYPSMLQFGTTSGRYSCGGGLNLQTLPRDDKRIKKGFIAPPGYKVVNADFSSLEPRIFSWVSKDPGLKEIWTKGLDMYSKIAIDVLELTGVSARETDDNFLKKVDPNSRQLSKVFVLAVPYGANAFRIAQLMKVPVERAQEIIDAYLRVYPYLQDYMENQEIMAQQEGKVRTEFGRVRHLRLAKQLHKEYGTLILDKLGMALEFGGEKAWQLQQRYKEAKKLRDSDSRELAKKLRDKILQVGYRGVELYYQNRNLLNNAKNSPIQMTAAHVCNNAMIKLAKTFKKHEINGWVALQVHDEITCLVKEDQAQLAAELLKDAMENNPITEKIDIPILAEPMIADDFASAK